MTFDREWEGPCVNPDAPWCGEAGGYRNHGCRNEKCREAQRMWRRKPPASEPRVVSEETREKLRQAATGRTRVKKTAAATKRVRSSQAKLTPEERSARMSVRNITHGIKPGAAAQRAAREYWESPRSEEGRDKLRDAAANRKRGARGRFA